MPVRPSAQHNWPILDTLIINEAKNKEHFISPEDSSQIIFTANGQTVSPQTETAVIALYQTHLEWIL